MRSIGSYSVSEDMECRTQEQHRNTQPHEKIRPLRVGKPHPDSGQQDCNIRNNVVTRTQPYRAHVDVFFAVAPEQQKADRICSQGEQSDQADGLKRRHFGLQILVRGMRQYEYTEKRHDTGLHQGRSRFPRIVSCDDIQAEAIDQRIS